MHCSVIEPPDGARIATLPAHTDGETVFENKMLVFVFICGCKFVECVDSSYKESAIYEYVLETSLKYFL